MANEQYLKLQELNRAVACLGCMDARGTCKALVDMECSGIVQYQAIATNTLEEFRENVIQIKQARKTHAGFEKFIAATSFREVAQQLDHANDAEVEAAVVAVARETCRAMHEDWSASTAEFDEKVSKVRFLALCELTASLHDKRAALLHGVCDAVRASMDAVPLENIINAVCDIVDEDYFHKNGLGAGASEPAKAATPRKETLNKNTDDALSAILTDCCETAINELRKK